MTIAGTEYVPKILDFTGGVVFLYWELLSTNWYVLYTHIYIMNTINAARKKLDQLLTPVYSL